MDLISQFEKRRGIIPPIPVSSVSRVEKSESERVLELAFSGRLERSYLIEVLPPYQAVFGRAIWICPDEEKASQKQTEEVLVFYPGELMDICQLAVQDFKQIAGLIAMKKAFGGTVSK
jgi:hypothetical protein